MRFHSPLLVVVGTIVALSTAIGIAACSGPATLEPNAFGGPNNASSSGGGGPGGPACTPCLTDQDCNGGYCAQIGGDTFCAPGCPSGNECSSSTSCTSVNTAAGQTVSACVPNSDVCSGGAGSSSGSSGGSGGSSGSSGSSSGGSSGSSGSSSGGSSGSSSGGSSGSGSGSSSSSGGGGSSSGGGTGNVGPSGGTVDSLLFFAVGDTRPPNTDDTSGYPTAIITQIYKDIQALSPRPLFGVATGDYMFASTTGGQAQPQLDLYEGALKNYTGILFPAMGNHECTGYTASNCGPGNADGITQNYTAFLSTMMQPLGQSKPYYSVNVNATNGSWTAKFVFVAANAWDSTQSSWLQSTLSQKTTYTFIVRHEPDSASTAPGVSPSDSIISQYPYTMKIVGHTHEYSKVSTQEVIFGNGGAPLASSYYDYGYGLFTQRADGAIQVDEYDYQTNQPNPSFRYAVNPDGTAAP
jgi:hypothetical protein